MLEQSSDFAFSIEEAIFAPECPAFQSVFLTSDEQTSSESLLLFQFPFITYLNGDLTRVFFPRY